MFKVNKNLLTTVINTLATIVSTIKVISKRNRLIRASMRIIISNISKINLFRFVRGIFKETTSAGYL